MMRRGQLFLIEVIIALSVMIILITALFSIQNFTTPSVESNLNERGQNIIEGLEDSGLLYQYFDEANYSYYTLDKLIFDTTNETKKQMINTISSGIPEIADFKAFTERFNETRGEWERIDIINFEVDLPTGSTVYSVEYYTPGYNGVYVEMKFILFLWYEVDA